MELKSMELEFHKKNATIGLPNGAIRLKKKNLHVKTPL